MYGEKRKAQKVMSWLVIICLIAGCMKLPNVSAATKKSNVTYYYTWLCRKKGGKKNGYYNPCAVRAAWKGNSLTMYASFFRCKDGYMTSARRKNKKYFVQYGKHTFKFTNKTKFYCTYPEGRVYSKKAPFLKMLKGMYGLDLVIIVKNGKVISISLHS